LGIERAMNIAFGPVPSRRLGRSLGINNIPPKHCSYSCVYCQLGPTLAREMVPRPFYPAETIHRQVAEHLASIRERGEEADYLTFVPDGEPTLDSGLGAAIDGLSDLGLPIAVISNSSLVWREDVRAALRRADWVSLKVDSVREASWRQINRPHADLELARILNGIRSFAGAYDGTLATETMLIEGVNDGPEELHDLGRFLRQAGIALAYLAIPHRPPAESGLRGPGEAAVNRAYQIVADYCPRVELLTQYEGDQFAFGGALERELLAIASVHPLRESAVAALLEKAGADRTVVERMLAEGSLKRTEYGGETFYVRRLPGSEA
jgi:wyosine [tRNA(Phe)-imidazoG37] synthetase (radical SAM superfamily)